MNWSWSIGKQIAGGFAITLLPFLLMAWVSYGTTGDLVESADWVAHTHEVRAKLAEIPTKVRDIRGGSRGFVITGSENMLASYIAGRAAVPRLLIELRALTSSNRGLQGKIDELETRVAQAEAFWSGNIELRRTAGFEAARERIESDTADAHMLAIDQVVGEIDAEEDRLLLERTAIAQAVVSASHWTTLGTAVLGIALVAGFGLRLTRSLTRRLAVLVAGAERLGAGHLDARVPVDTQDELGTLAGAFNRMADGIQNAQTALAERDWSKGHQARLARQIQGQRDLKALTGTLLSELAPLVEAQHGVFFLKQTADGVPALQLISSFGYSERHQVPTSFREGQGLVGQCWRERRRILLTEVPADYIKIASGLGESAPRAIVVLPILFENEVLAVLELASLRDFPETRLDFLERVADGLGATLQAIASSARTEELLRRSQQLTEELQAQQEELAEANRALAQKNQQLGASEEELRQQGDQLRQLNEELEERANLLTGQKRELEQKNREVDEARRQLEDKAAQLAITSKYKSDFLANMSHELRTPLNSLLILSGILGENAEGTLSSKQVEYAQTIHSSGNDLLDLINDILDLAKIESGTATVDLGDVVLEELRDTLERTFRPVAEKRKLEFAISLAPGVPPALRTDPKRLHQVLRNLLSNACKFTEHGRVEVAIAPAPEGWNPDPQGPTAGGPGIAFSVRDTGIGIPHDKHQVIFEAFQQAESGTSRKYGGTGLGLSICREIAVMLGGCIRLESAPGEGSTFTFFLPVTHAPPPKRRGGSVGPATAAEALGNAPAASLSSPMPIPVGRHSAPIPMSIPDDRASVRPGDRTLLVVEDDIPFARLLLDLAREHGFKALAATTAAQALALIREFEPAAVTLDLHLPDSEGWVVLDRLKHDPATRHIPVHVISVEDAAQRSLKSGAIAFLKKPSTGEALRQAMGSMRAFVDRAMRRLLVVEDDPVQRRAIVDLVGNGDVETVAVATGAEALAALKAGRFDCMVLDLRLPDMTGFQVIDAIRREPAWRELPIVVHTAKDLTRAEEIELSRITDAIVIKSGRSPERLLAETALFLHRIAGNLPPEKRRLIEHVRRRDPVLAGRKVLIVDDDMRNIFALTTVLELQEIKVVYAENGRDALAALRQSPDVDAILMDIMMPEMDGYETTRAIRALEPFAKIPILALTAKAMAGDREKCIAAGASDYLTKPVDVDQLLSLLRVWLYR